MNNQFELTRQSIVKIIRTEADGMSHQGVGFFVSPSHIFTATHLIEDAASIQIMASSSSESRFDRAIEFEIKKSFSVDEGDITLITVSNIDDIPIQSLMLLTADFATDAKFTTFGFPLDYEAYGLDVDGRCGKKVKHNTGASLIQLEDCPNLEKGFSGAPIYDVKLGGVVGMIVKVGKGAVAVTSDFICTKFPHFYLDSFSLKKRIARLKEEIEVGDPFIGEVVDKAEYGLFISRKGINGLLHRSKIAPANTQFYEQIQIGDHLEAVVYAKKQKIDGEIDIEVVLPKMSSKFSKSVQCEQLIKNCAEKGLKTLNLKGLGLVSLPSRIGLCRHLEHLNISDNQLSTLPAEIIQLRKLTALHLNNNKFSKIPIDILGLDSLKVLNLSDNRIQYLPDQLLRLNLDKLIIQNNPLLDQLGIINDIGFQAIKKLVTNRLFKFDKRLSRDYFEIGKAYKMKVKLIYNYGIFFVFSNEDGYMEGLLHKSQFHHPYLYRVLKKLYPVGKEMSVVIQDFRWEEKHGGDTFILKTCTDSELEVNQILNDYIRTQKENQSPYLDLSHMYLNHLPEELRKSCDFESINLTANCLHDLKTSDFEHFPNLRELIFDDIGLETDWKLAIDFHNAQARTTQN